MNGRILVVAVSDNERRYHVNWRISKRDGVQFVVNKRKQGYRQFSFMDALMCQGRAIPRRCLYFVLVSSK